jgi:hypothetical protein
MAQPAKGAHTPTVSRAPLPADPYPPYRRIYSWVFQAWLLMFLGVICGALVFYLISFLPR